MDDDLKVLLQDFYDYAKSRLDDHGHGSTYYFQELAPELYERLSRVISVGREMPTQEPQRGTITARIGVYDGT